MKKLATLLIICLLLTTMGTTASAASLSITYSGKKQNYTGKQLKATANGKNINISNYPGILENGTALIPYKPVFANGMGVKTSYNQSKKTLTMKHNNNTLVLTLGSKTVLVNGVKKQASVAPRGATYHKSNVTLILVPSRFVADELGIDYNYNSTTATVALSEQTGLKIQYGGKNYIYSKSEVNMVVDGKKITYPMPGLLINNYSMLPAKKIFTTLGCTYTYDSATKKLVLENENNKLTLTMNSKTATINGVKKTLGQAPLTVKNLETGYAYNMVPGSAVAELLGYEYLWTNSTATSTITTPVEGPLSPPEEGDTGEEPNTGDENTGNNNGGADVVTDYNVKIPLPEGYKAGSYTTSDDYHNKKFVITVPGNHTAFYSSNKPSMVDKTVSSVAAKANSSGNTDITITTSAIKGFKITESGNTLYVKVGTPKEIHKNIVVIDAGHGGTDPGAMGNSLYEKTLTLNIVKYAKAYFDTNDNIKVYYTRLTDAQAGITAGSTGVGSTSSSLTARSNFANNVGADLFISVHINAATSTTARGTEVYYCSTNNLKNSGGLTASKLATLSYNNLVAAVGSSKRGVKTANFAVIKNTKMPAILMEVAFISNKDDAAIMKNTTKLKSIGKSIYTTCESAFKTYPTGR